MEHRIGTKLEALAFDLVSAVLEAAPVDAHLVRAEGHYLAYLAAGRRYRELGFSSLGAFTQEMLQMPRRTAQERLQLHRICVARPTVERVFLEGRLSACKLLALGPVLKDGKKDEEADTDWWVLRAQEMPVRALRALIRRNATDTISTGRNAPGRSATDQSTANQSTASQSAPDRSMPGPGTPDSNTLDPNTRDPNTPGPSTTNPSTADPSTTDPSTLDPITLDPNAPDQVPDTEGRMLSIEWPARHRHAWEAGIDLARMVIGYDAPRYECIDAYLMETGWAGKGRMETQEEEKQDEGTGDDPSTRGGAVGMLEQEASGGDSGEGPPNLRDRTRAREKSDRFEEPGDRARDLMHALRAKTGTSGGSNADPPCESKKGASGESGQKRGGAPARTSKNSYPITRLDDPLWQASLDRRLQKIPSRPEVVLHARWIIHDLRAYGKKVGRSAPLSEPKTAREAARRLRTLQRLRAPLRVLLGRAIRSLRETCSAEQIGYADLFSFLEVHLGLSPRSAWDLITLSYLFEDYPILANAYAEGRIGSTKAYLVRRMAPFPQMEAYIARAEVVTHAQLYREYTFRELLQRTDPMIATCFSGPLPRPGLQKALVRALIQTGEWTRDRLRKEFRRRGIPEIEQGASRDPAENPVVMARLEVLLELLVQIRFNDEPPEEKDLLHPEIMQTSAQLRGRMRIQIWLPTEIAEDVRVLIHAVRRELGPRAPTWWAFTILFWNGAQEWTKQDPETIPTEEPILRRDGYRCMAPCCGKRSRLEIHHVRFRSRGGSDAKENKISLCATDHRGIIHDGHAHLSGRAPQSLLWKLGTGTGNGPFVVFRGNRIVKAPWGPLASSKRSPRKRKTK